MKNILFVIVVVTVLLTGCASHYDSGMRAFNDKRYPRAVSELSQVEKSHPNYARASATLTRAEFRLAVFAVKDSDSPSEAIVNVKKLIPLALKTESTDLYKVAFYVVLDELKDAKNTAYVKELIAGLLVMVKEKGSAGDVLPVIKGLTFKLKDFLFNSELRTVITDAIKKLKFE